ncbi:DUF4350 domain-containing protein [Paenibacillus harenae]|uniref:DUF4350 domain-containing protein n=1 Tax=Paenibacillus harenae TaxID=306543 RepID=UPI002792340E|nr:DUF4350 domain-containing protein [Paenibacillus harenae]MDQ0059766.1 hypothetical protein [Paenibacillus harenae]
MKKRFMRITMFAITLSLIAGIVLQAGSKANAAPQDEGIEVQTSIGYQGNVKQNEWYPVRFKLTNKTGEDVKGELVLSAVSSMSNSSVDYVANAELPMNTEVELTISVPGDSLSKNTSKIRFFKGQIKDGKAIPIIGNDYIETRVTSSYTIGVISRDPDTLNFMPTLNQRGYDITVIPIAEDELPHEGILLETLNTIVINDTATSNWKPEQVEAIKDWVIQGGTLVLSGGAGYSKTSQAFQDIAPVTASGTAELTSTKALTAYSGGTAPESTGTITVSKGQLNEAQSLLSEGGIELAASRKVGLGSVVYVAFDPSLAPLATWAGSASLWSKLLQGTLAPLTQGMINVSDNMFWNYGNLIDQFPSVKAPEFLLLLAMFAIYMVIVAPVLYFILAKKDRREWAWWLIPSVSIITGIVIFYFGAADKRVMSAHTIEIIEMTGQGDAVKNGATGVFVPNGGNVKLAFDEQRHIVAYPSENQSGTLELTGKTQHRISEGTSSVLWRSVPYWSTRKALLEKKTVRGESGQLDLAYSNTNGNIEVKVTNNTAADLTNVSLIMNGSAQRIGDLKKGESGNVALPKSLNTQIGYYPYGDLVFPGSSGNNGADFEYARERELVNMYMNRDNSGLAMSSPLIVGFSIDHDPLYTVNGDIVKADNLTMWVQRLGEVRLEGNRVQVPAGVIQPIITSNNLQRMDHYGNGVLGLGNGELQFEFTLPNAKQVKYDKLDIIYNNQYKSVSGVWSIWNEAKQQWVEATMPSLTDIADYLANEQSFRMKLTVASDMETTLPQIALEGVTIAP